MKKKAKSAKVQKPKKEQNPERISTILHSELVAIKGPAKITVISEANLPKSCVIQFAGKYREYICPNKEIAQWFEGQTGRACFVVAEGGPGEEILSYVGDAIADTAPSGKFLAPAPQRQKPQSTPPPPLEGATEAPAPAEAKKPDPEEYYEKGITKVKQLIGRQMILAALSCEGAERVAIHFEKRHKKPLSDQRISGIAMRMMISLEGTIGTLPPGNLDKYLPIPQIETTPENGENNK